MSHISTLSITLIAATLLALVTPATSAQAVSATDFDPGMIISDSLFYDSDAMTASQVQTFLNGKVRTCHPEKDPNPEDITCLKDFRQRTTAKSRDAYCNGYAVKTQTAAQIIDGVARSCGISQKVLLVTLQKEQGLVTHDWPSSYRFDKAMGYGCPDTAPCDTQYRGFFNQVYMAARQFKRYQALPQNYGYRAGRTNVIKYHPHNTSCGTASVYIENQATAALYIYTPYVPNSSALAAGFGTGNSCSSYGNRNFFLYYSTWFGSTRGIEVYPRLQAAYDERGGAATLGVPEAKTVWLDAHGGGWYQRMSKGTLFMTRSGIVTFRHHPYAVTKAYEAAGGPAGPWGWPITDAFTHAGTTMVEFQHLRVAQIDGKAVPGHPYSDVSDNPASRDYTEHADAIFWMARTGIAEGWQSRYGPQFRPTASITRDAMAAFLYRHAEATHAPGDEPSFVDVTPDSSEFYEEIEWLASTGVASGWAGDDGSEYRPLARTTRDAMAAFLFRLEAPQDYEAPAASPFVDVDPSSPFYREITWLAESGISTGWQTSEGVEFRPFAPISRDAMAAFLQRLDALD
ncbi:S-layer homology domain-containing protein [Demequina sp. NBRC 110053]|uniref:S-layer homology domain-containing protein n=1 Tax=Demequina sp. NBRC 110053 TaxID=1570342 RepID=UPI001F329602|nr:S-layer homology domain-containing protein [Demequina sp. NBRC 110053]